MLIFRYLRDSLHLGQHLAVGLCTAVDRIHEQGADAVRHAGPAIASAGLILAGTFASLTLAGNSILQQVGFAVSCGIALAAFVMAMFFSPSLTALVGNRTWWPGHSGENRG